MLDLFGNHIVGFPTRRLIFSDVQHSIPYVYISSVFVTMMLESYFSFPFLFAIFCISFHSEQLMLFISLFRIT